MIFSSLPDQIGMIVAIKAGGDTDTIASITGQIPRPLLTASPDYVRLFSNIAGDDELIRLTVAQRLADFST